MKINQPITPEEHDAADLEHRSIAESQKAHGYELAERIRAGSDLTTQERLFVAACLRRAVDAIDPVRKDSRRRCVPDYARYQYATATVHNGRSSNGAIEDLADEYMVSETAIKKVLGKAGPKDARRAEAAEATAKAISWERLSVVTQ